MWDSNKFFKANQDNFYFY